MSHGTSSWDQLGFYVKYWIYRKWLWQIIHDRAHKFVLTNLKFAVDMPQGRCFGTNSWILRNTEFMAKNPENKKLRIKFIWDWVSEKRTWWLRNSRRSPKALLFQWRQNPKDPLLEMESIAIIPSASNIAWKARWQLSTSFLTRLKVGQRNYNSSAISVYKKRMSISIRKVQLMMRLLEMAGGIISIPPPTSHFVEFWIFGTQFRNL